MLTPSLKSVVRAAFALVLVVAVVTGVRPACAQTTVVRWNDVLLECIRRGKLGPPMTARAIGVTHTCGFDAWAMYDDVAVGTRLGGALRRPPEERTAANQEKAFSYGEYRALLDLFPGQADFIRSQMAAIGYDPDDASTDPATASGIGNQCAKAVTDFRHVDGSNQLGDLHPGRYTDYTGYVPVNTVDQIADPNHWQPLRFCDGNTPGYVGAQWGHVVPFALTSSSEFRPGPPARYHEGAYIAQIEEILRLTAHLDDQQKMIAEYWADGPKSEQPPGHWTLFGEFVSARDHHTFDQDVQMFFALGNAEMDAGIAVWEAKRFYDSERPITAIRFLKAGKKVLGYVPFAGKQVIDGADWLPYQPCTFITPPFAEYPSGHSGFSAAGAEILRRFTGSDALGASVTFKAGSGRVEPGFAPSQDVTLSWATFSDAADQAGMSRRLGGIHFEQGDLDSRHLGRLVGARVWEVAQAYISGTVGSPAAAARTAPARPATLGTPAAGGGGELAIASVAPNPAAGEARVEFVLPRAMEVRLSIVDVQGREVAVLADGAMPAGRHQAMWTRPGRADTPAGMYFVRAQGAGQVVTRRFAVVR
ncbi:MAG TPA: T9SS type A sorting domain-containing protein [Candidatus Eisenbacteria bacterium]